MKKNIKKPKILMLSVSVILLYACGEPAQLTQAPPLTELRPAAGPEQPLDAEMQANSELRGRPGARHQLAEPRLAQSPLIVNSQPRPTPRSETPAGPLFSSPAPQSSPFEGVPPAPPAPPESERLQAENAQRDLQPDLQRERLAPRAPGPRPPRDTRRAPRRPPGQAGAPPRPRPPQPTPRPSLDPVQAQIALGAKLFFEPLLSGDNSMSCATCHDPAQGFSNGAPTAAGINGQHGNRNTPTIYEARAQSLTFWDGRAGSLEEQALGPIENPIEMNDTLANVVAELQAVPEYVKAFEQAYGNAPNATDIGRAIASFERAVEVDTTPFERFQAGEVSALRADQIRGMNLFFSNRTNCNFCHNGPSFSDQRFFNIGVSQNIPSPDLGRFNVTGLEQDRGSFKVPTLINVAQTAPYMHDGSLPDLAAVVAHYNRGGDPHPNNRLPALNLSAGEQADLVAFLEALSAGDNVAELRALQ